MIAPRNFNIAALLALSATLGVALGGCHDNVDPSFNLGKTSDAELDQLVHEELTRQHVAGFGLAIVLNGKAQYVRGYGSQEIGPGVGNGAGPGAGKSIPVDPLTTQFRWASVSKTLTGALVALKASQGEIDLDAEIRETYPRYDKAGVTLRRLMNHTAGIQHYDNGSGDPSPSTGDTNDPAVNTGIEWAVLRWIDNDLLFKPGSDSSYSSFGINLAGVVLEHAAPERRSFWEQMSERIAGPFEMNGLQPDYSWRTIPGRGKGYVLSSPDSQMVYEDSSNDVSWKLPSGGFTSTTLDAARFCEGLLGDKYPQAARNLLWTSSKLSSGKGINYGVGWGVATDKASGVRVAWHRGYQEKSEALIRVIPARRFCLVGFSNTRDDDNDDGLIDVSRVFGIVSDLMAERQAAGEDAIQVELDPAHFASLAEAVGAVPDGIFLPARPVSEPVMDFDEQFKWRDF